MMRVQTAKESAAQVALCLKDFRSQFGAKRATELKGEDSAH